MNEERSWKWEEGKRQARAGAGGGRGGKPERERERGEGRTGEGITREGGRSLGNDRTDGRADADGRDADWGRQSLAIDRLHKFKVWKPNFEHGAGIVG